MNRLPAVILALLLTSCNEERKEKVLSGKLPEDLCYVGGIPQIISISENASGTNMHLSYLDTSGNLVIQSYHAGIFGIGSSRDEHGEFTAQHNPPCDPPPHNSPATGTATKK